jgi:hypothetical protein
MPGSVTVFNSYNEPVTQLSVGGYSAGDIAGWSKGPTPPLFTPSALVVPRSKSPETKATFAIGPNLVIVNWNSFVVKYTVVVPDPRSSGISLDDDLILYLTVNEAILVTARGFVIGTAEPLETKALVMAGATS